MRLLLLSCVLAALAACKSDKKAGGGLEMTSNSAACKKAMACCEAYVQAEKGALKPDDVNLMCSGVALASTDADCDQFRQGHAASFEAKSQEVPAACK